MRYWLMKSEPETFSIRDLKEKKRSGWDGVRNYQARNFMRDEMKLGDLCLFYQSSCPEPGVVGVMKVSRERHPDPTQFDPKSDYFDKRASREKPVWEMVEVEFVEEFPVISLEKIRSTPTLKDMLILRPGNRLSITPVTPSEWKALLALR